MAAVQLLSYIGGAENLKYSWLLEDTWRKESGMKREKKQPTTTATKSLRCRWNSEYGIFFSVFIKPKGLLEKSSTSTSNTKDRCEMSLFTELKCNNNDWNGRLLLIALYFRKEFPRVKELKWQKREMEKGQKKWNERDKKSFQFETVAKKCHDWVLSNGRKSESVGWQDPKNPTQMNDDANRFMCSFYSRTSE